MKERRAIKKKEGFFSPNRATPRPIDSLKDSGFSGTTVKAYLRTIVPFAQGANDIRHARKESQEKGNSAIGNFIGYKIKDIIFAIPYALKLYSSGGTSAISDVEKGLSEHDIDYQEVVTVGKQAKEFYDQTKKAKESKEAKTE